MKLSNNTKPTLVDPDLKYLTMPEDQLASIYWSWYPGGSGPIGAMRQICSLIEAIAKLRGFNVDEWRRA